MLAYSTRKWFASWIMNPTEVANHAENTTQQLGPNNSSHHCFFQNLPKKKHHPKTAKDLQPPPPPPPTQEEKSTKTPTVKPKQQEFAGQSLNVKILSEELGATELKLALLRRFWRLFFFVGCLRSFVYLFWAGGFGFFVARVGFLCLLLWGKGPPTLEHFMMVGGFAWKNQWVKLHEFTLLGDFAQRFTVLFTTREFWGRKQDYI